MPRYQLWKTAQWLSSRSSGGSSGGSLKRGWRGEGGDAHDADDDVHTGGGLVPFPGIPLQVAHLLPEGAAEHVVHLHAASLALQVVVLSSAGASERLSSRPSTSTLTGAVLQRLALPRTALFRFEGGRETEFALTSRQSIVCSASKHQRSNGY